MKFLDEYRDPVITREYLDKIQKLVTKPWTIMEICGGQTHSLVRNGIIDLLPENVEMVHGPGCPVCVTPIGLIDDAIKLAEQHNVVLCSFGDMLRVPGSKKSLLQSKAEGADIRILYSPLDAIKLAKENPEQEFCFFAVGFETTAPANALSVIQASALGIENYSILCSHVLVPPAMEAILSDKENRIQGFLAAGHVCTIMGMEEYYPISYKYKIPIIITGFEPVDLVQGIYMCLKQLEEGVYEVQNQYTRVVIPKGNLEAQNIISNVFDVSEREWRGIGPIADSGYQLKNSYKAYDARLKFNLVREVIELESECMAGEILKGLKKPYECPHFRNNCTPENPLGAPMVSSEGACAAYFHYGRSIPDRELKPVDS